MKRLFCLTLVLCLATSLAFGQPLTVGKWDCVVETKYNLDLLIPSLAFCSGAVLLFAQLTKLESKGAQMGVGLAACVSAFTGLVFLTEAITPKRTFWFPKIDNNGTIWFEKKIKY